MTAADPQDNSNGTAPASGIDPATGLRLCPGHLADLQKSGLSDDTIRGCGFYSVGHGAPPSIHWMNALTKSS